MITLENLTFEDKKCYSVGFMQLLPNCDHVGWAQLLSLAKHSTWKTMRENMVRIFFVTVANHLILKLTLMFTKQPRMDDIPPVNDGIGG